MLLIKNSYILSMIFNESNLSLIQILNDHVEGERPITRYEVECLMDLAPAFIFEGFGYRGIVGDWEGSHGENISWSFQSDVAFNVADDQRPIGSNEIINVYEAEVTGFDVWNFLRVTSDLLSNSDYPNLISRNSLSIAKKEQEILAIRYGQLFVTKTSKAA